MNYVWPERKDLLEACTLLSKLRVTRQDAEKSIQILLDDLELYDDPQQGADAWVFPDEFPLIERLALLLHSALEGEDVIENRGSRLLSSPKWHDVQMTARHLLPLLSKNRAEPGL